MQEHSPPPAGLHVDITITDLSWVPGDEVLVGLAALLQLTCAGVLQVDQHEVHVSVGSVPTP